MGHLKHLTSEKVQCYNAARGALSAGTLRSVITDQDHLPACRWDSKYLDNVDSFNLSNDGFVHSIGLVHNMLTASDKTLQGIFFSLCPEFRINYALNSDIYCEPTLYDWNNPELRMKYEKNPQKNAVIDQILVTYMKEI